jgi:hypothetical protein
VSDDRVSGYFAFSAFVLSVVFLLAASASESPTFPSIQRLEIKEDAGGPIVQGLFGRFSWPLFSFVGPLSSCTCSGTPHCSPGSHLPLGNGCGSGRSAHYTCSTKCNTASLCGPPKYNTDCCVQCIQDVSPCVGCGSTGYGCS